ncbi:MAG TPA: hypothetical protein VFO36_09715, partial [Nitrospiraceae bacterium]|nr:hypothetical protein [Nitrospiraceae bacterium]
MTDTRPPQPANVGRPEYELQTPTSREFGVVEKPLTIFETLYNNVFLRKALLLVAMAVIWEVYARHLNNPLLVPTFTDTIKALWEAMVFGDLFGKSLNSIRLLLQGYAIGLGLAVALTTFAMMTQIGNDLLETLTAMFNPLPAIALLPISLIWFGLG